MEVDSTETTVVKIDESCVQTKATVEESPDIELSSHVKSSPEIIPSSQIVSPEDDLSNQKSSPQAVPSDDLTSAQAVPSEQTGTAHDVSSQAVSTQNRETTNQGTLSSELMPPPQKVPSPEVPSSEVTQVISSLPGPSSEAVPSKMTNGPTTNKKHRIDFKSMSTGVYLDATVVPILHLALVTLDRLRPADPVQYVIDFLLRHKAQYSKPKEQPAPSSSANHA